MTNSKEFDDKLAGIADIFDVLSRPAPAAVAKALHPEQKAISAELDVETLLVEHDLFALQEPLDYAVLDGRLRRLSTALNGADRLRVELVDFATLIWPTLIPKFGPPATLTDPCRSQRDRGGLVGQESPRGVVRRDSTGVSVRHRDD